MIKFYPSILPSDVKQICKNNPEHFLAYLDSLIKSKTEDERYVLYVLTAEKGRMGGTVQVMKIFAPFRPMHSNERKFRKSLKIKDDSEQHQIKFA